MRSKRVLRYYCDHCEKGRFSKLDTFHHEARCIYNPKRICRICEDLALPQTPMEELLTALEDSVDKCLLAANGCPQCVLAAVAQWRESVDDPAENSWDYDYKKTLALFWQEREPKPADNGEVAF